MKALLALVLLAGCTAAPIGADKATPEARAKCDAVADEYSRLQRLAERTAIGAVKGFSIGAAVNGATLALPKIGVATISMGSFLVPMAAFGFLEGMVETADRRTEILRGCLRDEGVKAY